MSTKNNDPTKTNNNEFGIPAAEFQPLEDSNSWFKVLMIVLVLILVSSVGLGTTYWFLHKKSAQAVLPEKNDTENHELEDSQLTFIDDEDAVTSQQEATPDDSLTQQETTTLPPTREGIVTISAPQGYYYVVVSSYIDGALARDYAEKLAQRYPCVMILPAISKTAYTHVALAEANSFDEARQKKEALKASYDGRGLWVIKY